MPARIFALFLLVALSACGTGFKNPTSSIVSSEIGERDGKLVVTKTKSPMSPVQVVPVDTLPVANQFGVLAHFTVDADNFEDVSYLFAGSASVRGAGLIFLVQSREHPERNPELSKKDLLAARSGIYDIWVKGIANNTGDVEITLTADVRWKGGWEHTFKTVSIVMVR